MLDGEMFWKALSSISSKTSTSSAVYGSILLIVILLSWMVKLVKASVLFVNTHSKYPSELIISVFLYCSESEYTKPIHKMKK